MKLKQNQHIHHIQILSLLVNFPNKNTPKHKKRPKTQWKYTSNIFYADAQNIEERSSFDVTSYLTICLDNVMPWSSTFEILGVLALLLLDLNDST